MADNLTILKFGKKSQTYKFNSLILFHQKTVSFLVWFFLLIPFRSFAPVNIFNLRLLECVR